MERRAGVWWTHWGGLVVVLASAMVSGLISGFTIYNQFDKRMTVMEFRWDTIDRELERVRGHLETDAHRTRDRGGEIQQ